MEDLADWKVHIEEPVDDDLQGDRGLQADDVGAGAGDAPGRSTCSRTLDLKAMGFNSARYIHTLYQVMNLAFADRDFYYGDPYVPPEEPIKGLLSKEYATGAAEADRLGRRTIAAVKPGDPYPFEGRQNPYRALLENWGAPVADPAAMTARTQQAAFDEAFRAGTTSIQAADEKGWVVSVTPSGGWVPARASPAGPASA